VTKLHGSIVAPWRSPAGGGAPPGKSTTPTGGAAVPHGHLPAGQTHPTKTAAVGPDRILVRGSPNAATYAPTHLRTYGSLSWARRTGNWLLDVTIKHGYQPLRAVGMLLAVYAVALLLLSDPSFSLHFGR